MCIAFAYAVQATANSKSRNTSRCAGPREQHGKCGGCLPYSLQRISEVVRFRGARMKAYGAAAGVSAAVAEPYQERLSQAKITVQVTKGFIDNALTIQRPHAPTAQALGDTT